MHNSNSDFDSAFGTYALPGWREAVRRLASFMPANRLGLWGASTMRRLSLIGSDRGLAGPHDIRVAPGILARLYPASNRCEKRAFAGIQTWDAPERAALCQALAASDSSPFIFLDVGANVGLYSLFLNAEARRLGREVHLIAVEPDEENRARLQFNIAAVGADVTVEPIAIAGEVGEGVLGGGDVNRGSIGLQADQTTAGDRVAVETLASLIDRHDLPRVDAMKVDIEGYDLIALTAFFKQGGREVFPRFLIVETGTHANSPIVDLALEYGYELAGHTKMNAWLKLRDTDGAMDKSNE